MTVPKLTSEDVKRLLDEGADNVKRLREDIEDRRCRRGKYAPPSGTCKVCGGDVVGKVRFRHSDLIGGPPPPSYVAHWACEKCGLMYERCPQ